MNPNHYVAIMAGGIGSRFWPQSRRHFPKQFLDILGTGQTLIQATFNRFAKFVPKENIFIVTGEIYAPLVKEQLGIGDDQIVAEPGRRNTAPCVAYMAYKLAQKDPNAVFVVAPSDHLITDEATFETVIKKALTFASSVDALVTLGMRPHRPHTGYGYIQYEEEDGADNIFKVKTFTEKPNLELAKKFIESGEFLWNAGIFIWDVNSIIKAFEKHQSDMAKLFANGTEAYNTSEEKAFIKEVYTRCTSVSIDYAIMETADNVFVIPASFGWSDLGTWTSLWEQHSKDYFGNAVEGENVMVYETENCMIVAPDEKLVIIQGLQDYCVVDTKDVLLICKTEEEQKIKEYNVEVKRLKGNKYL